MVVRPWVDVEWLGVLTAAAAGVVSVPAGRNWTRIFCSCIELLAVFSMFDHTAGTLLSSVLSTATDCTRNLSRQRASSGGSSFIACSRTKAELVRSGGRRWAHTLNTNALMWSHQTAVGAYTISERVSCAFVVLIAVTYCLGAVVLTCVESQILISNTVDFATNLECDRPRVVICDFENLSDLMIEWP